MGNSFARRLGEFSTQQLANMLGCPRLSPGCRNDGWYGELSRLWGLDHANYQNSRFFETVARVPRNGPMTTRWLPVVTGLGWLSPDFGVPGTFKDQWAANFGAEWLSGTRCSGAAHGPWVSGKRPTAVLIFFAKHMALWTLVIQRIYGLLCWCVRCNKAPTARLSLLSSRMWHRRLEKRWSQPLAQ